MIKKKILLFIKLPPPLTGAIAINMYVAESKLLNESFNFKIIPVSYKEDSTDIGSYSLKKTFIFISLWFKLFSELIFFKPDIVYFQISPLGIAFYRDFIFVLIIKLFKTKVLYHLHGKGINNVTENHYFKRNLYRFAFKNSSITCLSYALRKDIEKVYNPSPFIVNNGIPANLGTSVKKHKPGVPKILFLSNLFIFKGTIDFLDSLEILNNKGLRFDAVIIGGEAELTKDDLQSIIEEKMLSNQIAFLGSVFGEEKLNILAETDIFVHPTHEDAFPLILLEAMRAELPVISTFVGAIPEIIDNGVTGYLVNKKSPEEIAEKLEVLIRNPELRKKMGEAGRKKFLEKYTLEIFEQNMLNVFRDVLKNDLRGM